jgi:hypothetical protein
MKIPSYTKFALFLLVLCAPMSAQAQDVAAARTYFASASLAFDEARWIDCAHDFERSFQNSFAPVLLYNVGLCYQRAAGQAPDAEARPLLERALSAFQRYLREIPDADNADRVNIALLDIRARLARTVEAPLEVTETPTEAAAPVATPVLTTPTVETQRRGRYPLTIVGGALTVVLTAVAIGLGAHVLSIQGDCPDNVCADTKLKDEGNAYRLATNVMLALSGLVLAGTAVGFYFEFTATEPVSRAGLTLSGSF